MTTSCNVVFLIFEIHINLLSNQIEKSAILLSSFSEKISQQIENLPPHLISMQKEVEETKTLIKEYAEQASSKTSNKDRDSSLITEKMIDDFLIYSSVLGLEFLYALQLGLLKHKEFSINIDDFCSATNIHSKEYLYGYAVALFAIDVFSGSVKNRNIIVTNINQHFKDKIKKTLISRAEKLEEDKKQRRLTEIKVIEKYIKSK